MATLWRAAATQRCAAATLWLPRPARRQARARPRLPAAERELVVAGPELAAARRLAAPRRLAGEPALRLRVVGAATGCSSASAAGFLLQPVKAKATLKTSNREVRFTGRSLGQLRAGATELCGGREHWSGQREFTFHRAKLGQFCSLNWKSRYCSKPGLGAKLSLCPSSPN